MRWIIYPYTPKFISVLKNKELFINNQVICLSAPSGFSLEGKDGYIWGGINSGYKIREKIEEEFDGIWITPEIGYMSETEMLKAIEQLPVKGKEIYYSGLLELQKEELLFQKLQEMGAKEIKHRKILMDDCELSLEDSNFYKIQTPVIAVAGVGNSTQKFDLQMYLRKQLLNKGYTVSQIGTRPYCEMLGFHSMPDWMFHKEYTDCEKVFAFNHYVKEMELKEKPDVIILGIPEGIVPFNEKHPQGFGLKAFEICSAVHPDYLLMSLYCGEYTQEFYDEMNNLTKYRFHTEIDDFYISNFVPVSNSFKKEQLVFTYSENVLKSKEVFSSENLENSILAEKMIDKLSVYDEYEVI